MTKLLLAVSLMLSSLAFAGMPAPEGKSTVTVVRGGVSSTAPSTNEESAAAPTTAEPKKASTATSARKTAPSRK